MHPRLLKTFLAVARSRTITGAAEALHLAQSSVGDQIQVLETELGTALFTGAKTGLRHVLAPVPSGSEASSGLESTDRSKTLFPNNS